MNQRYVKDLSLKRLKNSGLDVKVNKRALVNFASLGAAGWVLKSGLLVVFLITLTGAVRAASVAPESESQIVSRYLAATREQQSALRGASMQVDFDANLPKLQRTGKLSALRNISKVGKVTYRMLGFNGDNSVKKEVIARYMAAEVQAGSGPDISITPQNYKFKFKGTQTVGGRDVYVLNVAPRKKEVGFFKGELWLDPATCMPVRESGRFVKNPSVFLKKMEFVWLFEIHDGVSIPQRMQSVSQTRLFGPVELKVNFTNFSRDAEPATVAAASTGEDQD